MQARFTMDGTLSSRIPGGMNSGCSITPGFTGFNDSKNPRPRGLVSWIGANSPASSPTQVNKTDIFCNDHTDLRDTANKITNIMKKLKYHIRT